MSDEIDVPFEHSRSRALLRSSFGLVVAFVAVMWTVEVLDTVLLDQRLEPNGIVPRSQEGLDGVLWAPFLHGGWSHLIANSLPFLVLGGLLAFRGLRTFVVATGLIILLGGVATWLLARTGNHIGASGVVFGYFGFLVGAVVFERRLRSIIPAAVAIVLYGGILWGLIPTAGVSWEGHLFGVLAGFFVARLLLRRSPPEPSPPDPLG